MENITFKQGVSRKELSGYFWAVSFPVIIFALALFVVMRFGRFGSNLIAPMVGFMWMLGAACAFVLPSHRKGIIAETHWIIVGYLIGLTGLREVIRLVSGTTTQMLMATYEQAMPAASGASLSGFLEYMLWILTVMVPVGFLVMEGKKVILFRRKISHQKIFEQLRGIREENIGRNGR